MMSLWDALRMNMMISYQELVRTFPNDAAEIETAYPIDSLYISLIILTFIGEAIRHHSNLSKK